MVLPMMLFWPVWAAKIGGRGSSAACTVSVCSTGVRNPTAASNKASIKAKDNVRFKFRFIVHTSVFRVSSET